MCLVINEGRRHRFPAKKQDDWATQETSTRMLPCVTWEWLGETEFLISAVAKCGRLLKLPTIRAFQSCLPICVYCYLKKVVSYLLRLISIKTDILEKTFTEKIGDCVSLKQLEKGMGQRNCPPHKPESQFQVSTSHTFFSPLYFPLLLKSTCLILSHFAL